jgi:hypothetical protein
MKRSSLAVLAILAALCICLPGVASANVNMNFEGEYYFEPPPEFHHLEFQTILVVLASDVEVPVLSGKSVIPTSKDPNDSGWLDELRDGVIGFVDDWPEACEAWPINGTPEECEAAVPDIREVLIAAMQLYYDLNKELVESMATGWNLDILPWNWLNALLNQYPAEVTYTYTFTPRMILQYDEISDVYTWECEYPGCPDPDPEMETESITINRQGNWMIFDLDFVPDCFEGGSGGFAITGTGGWKRTKGTIRADLGYKAFGEYDAGVGWGMAAAVFGEFGLGLSFGVNWQGDTVGDKVGGADDFPEGGYSEVANAEAATYGSNSVSASGIFNESALFLIPVGAVLFLRILRRKK